MRNRRNGRFVAPMIFSGEFSTELQPGRVFYLLALSPVFTVYLTPLYFCLNLYSRFLQSSYLGLVCAEKNGLNSKNRYMLVGQLNINPYAANSEHILPTQTNMVVKRMVK